MSFPSTPTTRTTEPSAYPKRMPPRYGWRHEIQDPVLARHPDLSAHRAGEEQLARRDRGK